MSAKAQRKAAHGQRKKVEGHRMDPRERRWLFVLIGVFLVVNIITLSPLVPWQEWMLWSDPTPSQTFAIEVQDYQFKLPSQGMEAKVGEYVEFAATSLDVTYGFGVFRKDGSIVFQMQVLPGMANRMVWKFDEAGTYDVRSTEYSGPRHSEMFIADAIRVSQ